MLQYLNKFFTKESPTSPKPLAFEYTYGGSPLQKQLAAVKSELQFKNSTISISSLTQTAELIGLKKQKAFLSEKVTDTLFIMYPKTISDSDKKNLQDKAKERDTEIVVCKPKQSIGCLKITPATGPAYYLVRREDIVAVQAENTLPASRMVRS